MRKVIFGLLLFFLAGCGTGEEQTENDTGDAAAPMHYENKAEQRERLNIQERSIGEQGGYPQSEQNQANTADYEGGYSDPFTNEESEMLTRRLEENKDIVKAQVASNEERIMIGLILKEHTDPKIPDGIEEQVKSWLPETDKQVVVFSDEVYWDRMKNLKARSEAENVGSEMGAFFEELFNRE